MAELDKTKIDALKAIRNSNLLIKLIQESVKESPETATDLLNELGDNLESLGGIDLSNLETLKGVDGKTPVLGEDYLTKEEIEGLEKFITEEVKELGEDLSKKLVTVLRASEKTINEAVALIQNVKDGKDGKDGKDVTKQDIEDVFQQYKAELKGSPDSPLEIVDKIKQVRGTKRLGMKNVRGLPELEQRVKDNTDDIDTLKEEVKKELTGGWLNSDGSGGGSGTDPDAIHDNVASEISAITEKVTPVGSDMILIEDSADSNNKKKVLVSSLPTGSGGEANTGANVGTGEGDVFKQKAGVELQFKTLKAGTNVTITDGTDEVTIDATGGGGATNLGVANKTSTTLDVTSDTGTDATLPEATITEAGLLAATDKIKLIATSGTNTGDQDLSNLQVKPAEGAFVDGDKTKLDGIEAGAEVNNISDLNANALVDTSENALHYHDADRARANHTGTQTASTISDFDTEVSNNTDVAANTLKISYTDAAAVALNTAKETNATHTGDVTGSGALTIDSTAISGKAAVVTLAGTEEVLVNEGGTLKKTTTQDIADLGGGGGDTNFAANTFGEAQEWAAFSEGGDYCIDVNAADMSSGNIEIIVDGSLDTTITATNSDTIYVTATTSISVNATENTFDIDGGSYDNKSKSVSAQASVPRGVFLGDSGDKMYVVDNAGDSIYQYGLGTTDDVSSATYSNKSFSISTQDISPNGFFIDSTGTKLFVIGLASQAVFQYTLSTAWDISTASYDSKSFSVSSQEVSPFGIYFKPDGTKMYICGYDGDDVNQYSLSTAWDVSTASFDNKTISVSSQGTNPTGLSFSSDGKILLVEAAGSIYKYSLTTGWDVSTGSYASESITVSGQDSDPYGASINADGTKLYMVGTTNDTVYQYGIGSAWGGNARAYVTKNVT